MLTPDATAPTNPSLSSSTHTVGAWSSDARVGVGWEGAADAASGLDGYSVSWDTSPGGIPDTVKDLEEDATATTSPSLPDGGPHWFHLRTRDQAGNWSGPVSLGPFRVDREVPTAGSASSPSHLQGVASSDTTVAMTWHGARDATSGLAGFAISWDEDPGGLPGELLRAPATATSATSPPLAPGSHYFHLRARDRAGNWSATVTAGPYVIALPLVTPPPVPPPPAVVPPGSATTTPACVVPRLRKLTLKAARKRLLKARCAVGRVKRTRSRTVRRGRVISQQPRAGTRRRAGTRVRLVVSRGRPSTVRSARAR